MWSSPRRRRSSNRTRCSARSSSRRARRDWPAVWRDIALGRLLRDERYDIAIDFHGGPRASLLTWLSRARVRIGYDIVGRQWMYTRVVARPRELRARHSVENQWDLLEPLGIARPSRDAYPVEMPPSPKAAQAVAARIAAAGVSAEHDSWWFM